MKTDFSRIFLIILSLLAVQGTSGQTTEVIDSSSFSTDTTLKNSNRQAQTEQISTGVNSKPFVSKYGFLLNDDKKYNPKYAWGKPAAFVTGIDLLSWSYNYWQQSKHQWQDSWARVSPSSWASNFTSKWWWDADDIETNFISHPFAGLLSYNVGRSYGYSFTQSFCFSAAASFLWEYLGEDNPPSRNDLFITPVGGALLGEIVYRVTSNILDERKRGINRVIREFAAGILDPTRAFSRMLQGKMFRVTHGETYQKAPLNTNFKSGFLYNSRQKTWADIFFELQFDYGDAFSGQNLKPFDMFRLKVVKNYSSQIVDNVNGYGFLFGKNQKERSLFGWFQNFDYWHNKSIKLAATGFGPSLISKFPIQKNSVLYSSLHLSLIPIAGLTSDRDEVDTTLERDYLFGGGAELKSEQTLQLSKYLTLGFAGNVFLIHNYEGLNRNNLVCIIKPSINLNLTKFLSVGFNHEIFYRNDLSSSVSGVNTQNSLYLQLFFEDRQRKDRYY